MNFTDNSILFQAVTLLFAAGIISPLAFRQGRKASAASFVPAITGSVLLLAFSILTSMSGSKIHISNPLGAVIPALAIDLYVDGMSAFFMLILGLVTLAVSVYSIGYSSVYYGKRSIRALGFLFNLFVLSTLLVIAANSIFAFIVFWELMSLSSFFLVIYEHEEETNIKSGITYVVMTHIGTAFILASFLAFYIQTGSYSFDSFRTQAAATVPHYIKDIAFVLAFIGFGTKAGLVPLHKWLPEAHPSAPSNVSALMSGVMIKVAIYGLARTVIDFGGPTTPESTWWGLVLAISGAASCIIGILYAAIERDIKKALAYSSIENIGIIVLGLGLAVLFSSYGLGSLAALALLASMYHSLNHAAFKSLLFMGAGSVIFRTHTKKMDLLGGLIKTMPLTALLFLVGAMAISGLPPLSGFVSEWLTFQALLSSYQLPNLALQISISIVSVVFALTIGLALATFVKIFGITFLARPRSDAATNAKEVPRSMIAGMGIAAAPCVLFGVMPFIAVDIISSAFGLDRGLLHQSAMPPFQVLSVPFGKGPFGPTTMSTSALVVMMAGVGAFFAGFILIAGGRTSRRIYNTWDCGFGQLNERMQYTAGSLTQPLRLIFRSLYKPHTEIAVSHYSESNGYLKKSVKVETRTRDIFDDCLYQPLIKTTVSVLDAVRRLQTGKINAYILYVLLALVTMLVLAGVMR